MKIKEGGVMNIQKKREAFEALGHIKRLLGYSKFNVQTNRYELVGTESFAIRDTCELNTAWETWQAAQAVPERTSQTFEDWLSDLENTKVYFGGYRERANEFAHQAWVASLKAKLPKDKILMPRSLDQKHIDYVVHQLAISSGASLISEVYECLIEAQEPR